jgi:hypothetical protein
MDENLDNKHYIAHNPPEFYDWYCVLSQDQQNITFYPRKGCEPNWFQRKLQEICFGVKWEKKNNA